MTKVAIISTVKAPVEQLDIFINYHLKIGIDKIILFFDDPDDVCVTQLKYHEQVTIIPCTVSYWKNKASNRPESIEGRQIINVNEGIAIAKNNNYDWIAHIDSDELINPIKSIKIVLENCHADCVRFELLEAVSDNEYYENIYLPTLFKKKSSARLIKIAKSLGCSRSIYNNEYLRGHKKSKMAIRLNSKIQKFAIHEPMDFDASLVIVDTKEIQLLHFDCVGIENWKSKWNGRIDGSATAELMRANRNKQLQAYIRAKESGDTELSNIYRQLHTIPLHEKIILFLLGMLKRVNIQHKLYNIKYPREHT